MVRSKKQAEIIIKRSMNELGIKSNLKTDPKIVKNILNEMKLDDLKTTSLPMKRFFSEILIKPKTLKPMLNSIKQGIVNKHPAVVEFLELALKKKWLKKSKNVQRSLHVAYILDELTVNMSNNHNFFIEVQNHYKEKERKLGLDTLHTFKTFLHALKISPDLFKIAKAFSLDPLMIYFRIQKGLPNSKINKKELKKLYNNKEINYIEYKLLSPIHKNEHEHITELVRINIYEAGITEFHNGFEKNALCAYELSENLKKNTPKVRFKKKKSNLYPIIDVSQDWVSLYLTWNMAFILGNLNDLDMIFSKLMIPSIINSKKEEFLGARITSLWLSINHSIFRAKERKEIIGPENKIEMAKAWSKINERYAFNLSKREIHENSEILRRNFDKFFYHPYSNLSKLVKAFLF